eukprot:m51a1_g10944 hypothetical protein (211) ;mRNA; r:189935-190716
MLRIVWLRHAHAAHNAAAEQFGYSAYSDERYRDALLTSTGVAQASKAAPKIAALGRPWRVYLSPARRCMQTARSALPDWDGAFIADDRLLERLGAHPCNHRSERSAIEKWMPEGMNVDLSRIPEKAPWPRSEETDEQVRSRMTSLRDEVVREALGRAEGAASTTVVIVSHGDAMWTVFNQFVNNAEYILEEVVLDRAPGDSPVVDAVELA